MTADPAALRALAARVETGDATNEDVARALGWQMANTAALWWHPNQVGWLGKCPPYLADLTAAASAMPEGWVIHSIRMDVGGEYVVILKRHNRSEGASSTTEPRARISAALRARAADLEAGG